MNNNSFKKNLTWIFIGNLSHAVLSFLLSILVARCFARSDFGIVNYAAAWITLYNAIASLGINSVINKYTTENLEESNSYLCTAIVGRLVISIFGVFATAVTVLLANPNESKIFWIAVIQSLTIVFGIGDTLVFWFRYKREANLVAILRMIAFFVSAVIRIVAILILQSVYIYTFGLVFETGMFSILLIYQYRKRYIEVVLFSFSKFKVLLKNSYPFVFSAILATVGAQTDRIMLNNMLSSEAVAGYSIACSVAGMMSVIVAAIIEGFRPELFANIKSNKEFYFLRLKQVYGITFWLCICYGLFITFFSKQILYLLYGSKYIDASPALALVVWYTSFSYFGTINNIYMVAENKEKWVQITTLTGALTNVLVNWLLIPRYGIMGAAFASLVTQFLANFGLLFVIPDLRPLVPIVISGMFDFKNLPVKTLVKMIRSRLRIKKDV